MGMSLYEIDDKIENCFDPETGEILYDLDELEMEREIKIDNIACFIKSMKAEADAIKNERANLFLRQKTLENQVERLQNYLKESLKGEKFKSSRCSISYRSSQSVNADVSLIPKKYQKIEISADKTAIKEAIKAGTKVKGAELVTNVNMIIK